MAVDADDVLRTDAPGHLRNDFFDVDDDFLVEDRIRVAWKLAPRINRPLPHLPLRRIGTSTQIFVGLLVRRDHTHLGTEFDRQIADRQSSFDRHVENGAAGIFDRIAGPAGRADMPDQRQDHILSDHAARKLAFKPHTHGPWPALDQRLGSQHMRQLARPDTERQRAEAAMGAGMTIPANDQATGKAQAKLGPHDVNDALAGLVDIEHLDAAGRGLDPQRSQ